MRPTVHDIASEAGVSLATVDRVLNKRPGVRRQTVNKVEGAVARLGYVRDVAAANLAKKRVYPLVFIVPDSPNSFMRNLEAEIRVAAGRSAIERTTIKIVKVPAFDPDALESAVLELNPKAVSGVALVAVDTPGVRNAVDRLLGAGVPVTTLVSDLPGARQTHFCGIDNRAAGRTAASLIGRFCSNQSGKVLVVAGAMTLSDHMDRAEGFAQVLGSGFVELEMLGPVETNDETHRVRQAVSTALADDQEIIAIYNLGAGNRGLIDALCQHPNRHLSVIVHELTAHTRQALSDGLLDAVLNQDCGHEVRSAIRVLKARADGVDPLSAQERIRLDIFVKDNLP